MVLVHKHCFSLTSPTHVFDGSLFLVVNNAVYHGAKIGERLNTVGGADYL